MMANTSQGIYSPLPQSLSDSDSEKDLPVVVRSQFTDRHVHNSMHDGGHHNGYVQPLQMIKLPEVRKATPAMSAKRKFCFVLSIAVCFLTIIIFLWVLPCSETGTCPIRISNWENQHDSIELTGKINLVKSIFKSTFNMVMIFKRNLNAVDSQSGVISVLGNNGAVAWYVTQVQTPTQLNCYLIDVNGDDINDCLLLGEMSLEAIDPISGVVFWHAHNHSYGKAMKDLEFPVILQDLDFDNINEILTTTNPYTEQSKFLIISGKTGVLLGQINVDQCEAVFIVNMNASHIIYLCKNNDESSYHQVSLSVLISNIFNRSEMLRSSRIDFKQFTNLGYVLNGHRLSINNVGSCPSCHVDIALVDDKTNNSIFSWSYQNSYAFIPALFSFKLTKMNMISLKGHVNGFILKLWQWVGYKRKDGVLNVVKRHVLSNNNTMQVNSIMERIVLITFNATSYHVINASLTEITQLCFLDVTKMQCQPSLSNQNDSLLIADLDMDGSQELVSYSSTFVQRDETRSNWQLVSNMKVIRLEAELPKLYEVAK